MAKCTACIGFMYLGELFIEVSNPLITRAISAEVHGLHELRQIIPAYDAVVIVQAYFFIYFE